MPAYLINEELAGNRLDKFVCENQLSKYEFQF